jgi:hypothetical protein
LEGAGKEARQASSFLKKRSKKLLSVWAGGGAMRAPGEKSFFGSFFSKKELLAFQGLPRSAYG